VAYCEIPYEKETKGTNSYSWPFRNNISKSNEKVNVIAGCLENRFTSHDLCDENHERQVETNVEDLLASVGGTPLGKVRPCDMHNLAN
jgi:hypothetical protein